MRMAGRIRMHPLTFFDCWPVLLPFGSRRVEEGKTVVRRGQERESRRCEKEVLFCIRWYRARGIDFLYTQRQAVCIVCHSRGRRGGRVGFLLLFLFLFFHRCCRKDLPCRLCILSLAKDRQ